MSAQQALPASIKGFSIASNNAVDNVDITQGIISFQYFETMLNDTKSMIVTFTDTGGSVKGMSVLDGLPLVGGEKCSIKIEDNYGNEMDDIILYVNSVTPMVTSDKAQIVTLNLVSKEYLLNEKISIYKRFDGHISGAIKKILTDELLTEKTLDIEESSEDEYSFVGNGKKPFYVMNVQSKKAIPGKNLKGKSAGFFLWETHKGYHFKSIETLLGQKHKVKIVYTGTNYSNDSDTLKALTFRKDVSSAVDSKGKIGSRNMKMVFFDPFTTFYGTTIQTGDGYVDNLTLGGEKLPTQSPEIARPGKLEEVTRTTYAILDTGTLPQGDTTQQLQKSYTRAFDAFKVTNQATMRYNQFFTFKVECTIAANFSLNAGDAVYVDSPKLTTGKANKYDSEYGGLYIISELCHQLTPTGSFTKLNLVRDSIGRVAPQ